MDSAKNDHEAARQFAWERWSAFVDGELSGPEQERMEALQRTCPDTAAFLGSQASFDRAVRQSLDAEAACCPPDLQDRIKAALDKCEDAELGVMVRFPWISVGALAAASVMLAASLIIVYARPAQAETGDGGELAAVDNMASEGAQLQQRLAPMVAHVRFEAPKASTCRYRAAQQQYSEWFADAPDLPRNFDGTQCRVSHFECPEMYGRKVMYALYDDPSGERFALIVFRCARTADLLPEFLNAAEMDIAGRQVLLWREGNYVRVLVCQGQNQNLRHRAELLRNAA